MAEIFPTKNHEHVIITHIDTDIIGIITHPQVWLSMTEQGLEQWCIDHDIKLIGMTLDFPDMETAMLFKLSWGL